MNNIKYIKYLLTALFLMGSFIVLPRDPLEGYLTEAANNNPGLKSKFSEYMAALEKVPQVGAFFHTNQ